MDYKKIYDHILKRAENRKKQKRDGLHKHRIVPGFEGGQYISENIVLLTRKEHRIIHKLRYKIFGKWQDIASYLKLGGINCQAWNKGIKTGQIPWNKGKPTSLKDKTYEEIYGEVEALRLKNLRREFLLKSQHFSKEEVRSKAKQSLIEYYKNNESKNKGVSKSELQKQKQSEKLKGKTLKESRNLTDEEYIELKKEMSRRALGNKSTKGKSWYNNGTENRLFFPQDVKSGWFKGKLTAVKKTCQGLRLVL